MKIFLIILVLIVVINLMPAFETIFADAGWGAVVIAVLIIGAVIFFIIVGGKASASSNNSSYNSNDSSDYSGSSSSSHSSSGDIISDPYLMEAALIKEIAQILYHKPGTQVAILYNSVGHYKSWILVTRWGQSEVVSCEFDNPRSRYYFATRDGKRYYPSNSPDKESIYYFDML